MKRTIIIAPVLAQDALDELKDWLAVSTSIDDATLTALLRTALDLCEDFTGLVPVDATCEEVLRATGEWTRLATRPVQAITQAQTIGADGTRGPLAPEAYALDLDSDGGARFRLTRPVDAPRIAVRFTAGLVPDWAMLPDSLRHGALRLAAHAWRSRDEDALRASPPASIAALWRPWRRVALI